MPLPGRHAGCAADFEKEADGSCQACVGGATAEGGVTSVCGCSGLAATYLVGGTYDPAQGCPCAENSAQDATDLTCSACVGGATSASGFGESCVCTNSGDKYAGTAYNPSTGCACATNYAKPADDADGPCSGAL
jgi:hypothetical protein